jgi:hypothetical protein
MPQQKCNACLIHAEIKKSRNHLVLSFDRVFRLLGIASDKHDWYYMLEDVHGVMTYLSCSLGVIDLYPFIERKYYRALDNMFALNKQPQKRRKMSDISDDLPSQCFCKEWRAYLKKDSKNEKTKKVRKSPSRNNRSS